MTTVGTHGYTAPEILRGEIYGRPADVYSWAILCAEILTGRERFFKERVQGKTWSDLRELVVSKELRPSLDDDGGGGGGDKDNDDKSQGQAGQKKNSVKAGADIRLGPLRKVIQLSWSSSPQERPRFSKLVDMLIQLEGPQGSRATLPTVSVSKVKAQDLLLEELGWRFANKVLSLVFGAGDGSVKGKSVIVSTKGKGASGRLELARKLVDSTLKLDCSKVQGNSQSLHDDLLGMTIPGAFEGESHLKSYRVVRQMQCARPRRQPSPLVC